MIIRFPTERVRVTERTILANHARILNRLLAKAHADVLQGKNSSRDRVRVMTMLHRYLIDNNVAASEFIIQDGSPPTVTLR